MRTVNPDGLQVAVVLRDAEGAEVATGRRANGTLTIPDVPDAIGLAATQRELGEVRTNLIAQLPGDGESDYAGATRGRTAPGAGPTG